MRIYLAFCAAIGLAGCAQPPQVWYHPGEFTNVTLSLDAAREQCVYEAASATPDVPMGDRNWIADNIEAGAREHRLAIMCMHTKGWYQGS